MSADISAEDLPDPLDSTVRTPDAGRDNAVVPAEERRRRPGRCLRRGPAATRGGPAPTHEAARGQGRVKGTDQLTTVPPCGPSPM